MITKISINDLLVTTKKKLNYIVACIMQIDSDSASNYTSKAGDILASKLSGAAAATGFLGLVATFGTAGTGTAIASLSGAAATSATLAWVGGIVGGGMFAGTILTGGLGLAVGVGAYRFFKSEPREYESLLEIDKKIMATCSILIKAINEQIEAQKIPTIDEINLINLHSITPLYQLLLENKNDISSRLDFKNSTAFQTFAIDSFKKDVVDFFSKPESISGLIK
jgi:hypothetical protein